MVAIRTTMNMILKEIFHHSPLLSSSASSSASFHTLLPCFSRNVGFAPHRTISFSSIRCAAASDSAGDRKVSSRLSQVQQLLQEAEERARSAGDEPTPKITLDHVTLNFARSGGPGGQNVNKVNTKVDMRFNVKNAFWLSDRIRERIIQMEKNRINKDGATSKMLLENYRQLLTLLHMCHLLLQKNRKRKLPKWLLLESRSALKAKRLCQIKRHLGEVGTVGTSLLLCHKEVTEANDSDITENNSPILMVPKTWRD